MNSSHPDAAVKSGSDVGAPYAYDGSAAEAAAYEERAKYEESKMPQGSGGVGISEAIKLAKAVEKNFTTHQLGKAIFFVPCILYCRAAQTFWGLMLQTPNLRLAQILKVYQVSGPSADV